MLLELLTIPLLKNENSYALLKKKNFAQNMAIWMQLMRT